MTTMRCVRSNPAGDQRWLRSFGALLLPLPPTNTALWPVPCTVVITLLQVYVRRRRPIGSLAAVELHRVSAIDWRKQLQGRDGRSAKTILAWFPISGELYFTKNLANNAGYDPTSFTGEAGGTISNQ